jgi:hypothetical protein
VAGEVVQRVVGGGEDFDVEVLEQLAWPEPRLLQLGADGVIGGVRRRGTGLLGQAENALELVAQPVAGRRSLEQWPRGAELAPDAAGLGRRSGGGGGGTQPLQRHAAGVDQAGDVVVRADQQRGGIRKRGVVFDDGCINVAVRRNDGEVLDPLQQRAGNTARSGIRGEEPVGVGGNRL